MNMSHRNSVESRGRDMTLRREGSISLNHWMPMRISCFRDSVHLVPIPWWGRIGFLLLRLVGPRRQIRCSMIWRGRDRLSRIRGIECGRRWLRSVRRGFFRALVDRGSPLLDFFRRRWCRIVKLALFDSWNCRIMVGMDGVIRYKARLSACTCWSHHNIALFLVLR